MIEMADRFDLPVITLVDTAGAYPGVGAEERGQAEAIARSTEMCLISGADRFGGDGEGGSGGAIAIATGNRVYMLEHSIYASSLRKVPPRSSGATDPRQGSGQGDEDHRRGFVALGIVDGIIPEPLGGAHRDPDSVIAATGDVIANALGEFSGRSRDQIRNDRRQKFLAMGRSL